MESDFTSHIYPPDSILWAVHLVGLPGCSDRKPLKLLDLEFANSIAPVRQWAPARRKLTKEYRTIESTIFFNILQQALNRERSDEVRDLIIAAMEDRKHS